MAGKKKHRPYELKEYNPNWSKKFEEIANTLRGILDKEILEIHHVGSTSIPGMVAKPQIDVLVVVKDISRIKNYYKEMSSSGFIYLGNYIGNGEDCFAIDERDGRRISTIHCVQAGHKEIKDQLNFKNYLIAHEDVRIEYSNLKKELYEKYSSDYSLYGPGKRDFIIRTMKKANQWAKKN